MDIAVTGSTGLIGTPLCSLLEERGHNIIRVTRSGSSTSSDVARWDPKSGTIDTGAFEGIDAVIHLAGEPIAAKRWTPDQRERIEKSRTEGTALLCSTLAELKTPPKRLISGSAIGYYGDTASRPTTESAPAGTGFLADLCLDWEAAAKPAVDAGISTAFIRTGVVQSTDGGALEKQLPFFRIGLGGRSGNGRQYVSWIAISDAVRAIAWLVDNSIEGPVNLTAPTPVTNAEFTKTLGKVLKRPTTIIPMFGPRLLFGRDLADALLLESQRIIPEVLMTNGFEFNHETLEPALRDLLD